MKSISHCFTILSMSLIAHAQTLTPFSVDGYLTSMSTKDLTNPRSGGLVNVNGMDIEIPDNLLVGFPATFIPFAQVAAAFPNFGGDDGPPEVSIVGNVVDGHPTAGMLDIASPLLQASQGEIESITFDPPSIKIKNGPIIKINDPNAVYSKGYTLRPFFTADDANPSISSFQGFPMCIPRSSTDPLCPLTNRPKADNTMPDSLVMAPFAVGDFLDYSGIVVNKEVICYSIVSNLLVVSSNPGYIRMEDALIGVIDSDPNVEFSQSKFIGFTTDSGATIEISAVDVDPCTGDEKLRILKTGQGIDAGAVRNRFRYLTDRLPIGDYTREYHITLSSGTQKTKNGIAAGQYRQPVTEWVFPELVAIGAPPVSLDFSHLSHLANGFGPDDNGFIFHQLSPWPGRFPAPTPSKNCPDKAPPVVTPLPGGDPVTITADAGLDLVVRPGTLVSLSAKNTAPNVQNTALTFSWAEINPLASGAVTLNGANTATPSFVAPLQGTIGILKRTFEVTISHTSGTTSTDRVVVTTDTSAKDIVTIDSYSRVNSQGGTITVTAHTNLVGDPSAQMVISVNGGAIQQMTKVGTNTGKFTYTQRSTAAGLPIVVTTRIGTISYGTANSARPAKRAIAFVS